MDATKVLSDRARAPLRAASAVRSAARRRGKNPGNLVHVYGHKPRRYWVLASDLEFANFLDLESDQAVKTYDLDPDRVFSYLGAEGYAGSKPDSMVLYYSGHQEMREVKYQSDIENDLRAHHQAKVQSQAAMYAGYSWRHFTELHAEESRHRLMNWLRINGVMHEAKHFDSKALEATILKLLAGSSERTLAGIRDAIPVEWRLGFTAIFRLYQQGRVSIDLSTGPLTWSTGVAAKEGI